ncbi:synaptonemal complex protein 2 isoform X2 [Tachyglossus aculeatus]|uniref:synaptonemal complex protein 2 isoform X2 n=1 Tax=Tachyglossus aculeatus TaxID=9261 RepID=UPI0018F666EA|nr:synaptonemal complex protein 2 isoform X2 [Tachyglossus aculeatus]
MAVEQGLQKLESCVDIALEKNDFRPLEQFLRNKSCGNVKLKCTKTFFNKLDNLICRELHKKNIKNASAVLNSFGKCIKNINILGEVGISVMIKQGLVQKMVIWFEKCKECFPYQGNVKDTAMIKLAEDFFGVLMTVHGISTEGKEQVLNSFVEQMCALAVDMRINIFIQKEVMKVLNVMLSTIPQDILKRICSTQTMSHLMCIMGKRIFNAGDYYLQVAITEALCRMTSERKRGELAGHWFSMEVAIKTFKKIKDSEFETDCRDFLNTVNTKLGSKQRVFTFLCSSLFLNEYELQMPLDENLQGIWIGFNLCSRSISFHTAQDNECQSILMRSKLASDAKIFKEHPWETLSVPGNEVEVYNLEVKNARKLLTLTLKNTVTICKKKGKQIKFYFDTASDILDITQRIYGTEKYKGFIKKQAISTTKTTLHVVLGEEQPQTLVPGDHNSLVEEQKANRREPVAVTVGVTNQEDRRYIQHQGITPDKVKMSQAVTVISNKHRFPNKSTKESSKKSSHQKKSKKLSSKMLNSVERTSTPKKPRKVIVAKDSELIQNDQHENMDELLEIMPESVAVTKKNKPSTARKSPINTENLTVTGNLSNESCAKEPAIGQYAEGPGKSGRVMTSEFNDRDWEIKEMKNKAMDGEFNVKAALFLNKINNRYIQQEELTSSRKSKVPLATNRTCLNKSDLPLSKEKPKNKSRRQQKKTTSINVKECSSSNIYEFSVNESADPTIQLQTAREREKKHSFSGNDPDHRGDSNADSHLLKESNQKLKPQHIGCSRNKTAKKPKQLVAKKHSKSPVVPVNGEQLKPTKAPVHIEVDETTEAPVAKRARRATITTKNSKDRSNSESGIEQESSLQFISNEENLPEKQNIQTQSEATQSKNLQGIVSPDSKDEKESPKFSDSEKDVHLEVSPKVLPESPSSVEEMRCAEKTTEGSYTQEYDYPLESSHLYQQKSTPEKEPLNQPSVTQAIMDKIVRSTEDTEVLIPVLEATINSEDATSPSSEGNLRESEQKKTHINVSQNTGEESVLPFGFSMLNRKRKKAWDASLEDVHESEPIKSTTLKRRYHNDGQSDYGEVEMREENEAAEPSVLSKNLLKPDDTAYIAHKGKTSAASRNDVSIPGEELESEYSDIGCQELNTEFQDDMTRISSQPQTFRTVLQELHLNLKSERRMFEKDTYLDNLETEFLDFMKNHLQKFCVYWKSEQLRDKALKNALETFISNSTEQEKNIFTTEMQMMRQSLNRLRENYLKKIAIACKEEDVLHIRRGVMSLLMQI